MPEKKRFFCPKFTNNFLGEILSRADLESHYSDSLQFQEGNQMRNCMLGFLLLS